MKYSIVLMSVLLCAARIAAEFSCQGRNAATTTTIHRISGAQPFRRGGSRTRYRHQSEGQRQKMPRSACVWCAHTQPLIDEDLLHLRGSERGGRAQGRPLNALPVDSVTEVPVTLLPKVSCSSGLVWPAPSQRDRRGA